MVAIGMGLAWAAYTGLLYGYSLLRGYDVSFKAMFSSKWPTNLPPLNGPSGGSGLNGNGSAGGGAGGGGGGSF